MSSAASTASTALVDMATQTGEARKQWNEYVADFLKGIAQMILQTIILNALKSASNSIWGGSGAAEGGSFPRMAARGVAGVDEVSSDTYLRKFNVLAGEAGREVLTVLARPHKFAEGGIEGYAGIAQGHHLLISPIEQVRRSIRAAEGYIPNGGFSAIRNPQSEIRNGDREETYIKIELSPELEARIISSSVARSKVEVLRDVSRDTPMRKAVSRVNE